jgi:inner membrane protein
LLLTSSAAYLLGLTGQDVNLTILLSTGLSTLPDIDLRLRITHRKYTHNIFFGIFAAFLIGLAFDLIGLSFYVGFWSTFIGVLTHLAGDLMTYRGFNPIAPFGTRKYSLKLFKSSNRLVNNAFLLAGAAAYVIYLVNLLPVYFQH